ncbi:DUF4832 domain-containing protein [Microbacterium marinilacus]|uniref:DUF4832 domain-containing protein n=1 Tax=Microbacterium marinilacus TaxID=415209 RepID=A0ABP7BRY2_9MICO|nr:DUF4832 domain-containing protein [Microbacterium marinilacus]MBY0690284.1 DUF4832 domain-containing protein [Microbacterium marinilacus]
MRKLITTLGTAVLVLAALAPVGASAATASDDPVVVLYEEDGSVIANPERGFYHHTETHYRADGSGYVPLDPGVLAGYRAEGITQILRVFYLEAFVDSPTLDPAFLDLVQADFDAAREAGVSVITRFAYAQGGDWPYVPPYGDAPLDVVLAHIDQLAPVLQRNADVVPVVQSGFVGLWGEGYYTDHFVTDPADPGTVTDADWESRAAVVDALLEALPPERGVQVRTMLAKQRQLDVPTGAAGAIDPSDAYSGSDASRIGHHNDCLLAAPDDWGTFLSDPIELDQEYLEADSAFVPVGGETCNVNPPRSEWPSASAELARYHYSYLNRDYHQDVLASWGTEGLAETARRLGYRFVLTRSEVEQTATGAQVTVEVRNDGWAAPYNPRDAVLVLADGDRRVELPFATGGDARRWAPGTTTTLTAEIPAADVGSGTYELALGLPAADAGTADDPRFAVRTANVGTWDAAAGLNLLGQTVHW